MKDGYNIGLQELEDKAQEFIRLMYGMAERQLLEYTHSTNSQGNSPCQCGPGSP